jgi:cell wall-associated NlpC family hydrolase
MTARQLCIVFLPGCFLALLLSACSASSPRFTHKPPEPAPRDTISGQQLEALSENQSENETVKEPIREVTASYPESYLRETNPSIDRHGMLTVIMSKMGIPYDFSGMDNDGMDCSGFISVIFQEAAAKSLPRASDDQFGVGIAVDRSELQFGDLVFFNTTGRVPSHVGIYVGDGLFAHASLSLGVTVSFMSQEYYRQRYVGARRVIR